MEYSSGEDSDISDSEIFDYKDKPYQQLKNGTLKVKFPNGILRCPFCAGKKKQNFKYKDLHQHASGVGKGSSNRSAKQKANHLALALYLENELANDAEVPLKVAPPVPAALISEGNDIVKEAEDIEFEMMENEPLHVAAPTPAAPISEKKDVFCVPFTGIVVNVVKEAGSTKDVLSKKYWMNLFSKYEPERVKILFVEHKQNAQVLVSFNKGWTGLYHALQFEKAFEDDHHGKKEWTAAENPSGSGIYAWMAREDDFESQGPVGAYLRTKTDLTTLLGIVQEPEIMHQ